EDEYESICPLDQAFQNGMLPFACLYLNSRLFSSSCKATEFVKDILPKLFSRKAVRQMVPAATYYCREVHDIYKTLVNGVVVQAFPTNGYYQRMFFLTGGPFVGLVMAIAFYFPFAAIVQSIVHERETWQKKYLILIGVHPIAILVSKLLMAFGISITASVFLTIAVAFCIDIPTSTLYTLVYMYSLSLCALAFVIGVIVPGERAAIVATPFILFLFVTPALVDGRPTEVGGASMLLPPTVFAKAIAYYTQVAQLDQNHITQSNTLQEATWVLFGLLMLYLALAFILEHLFIPNSALERLFRRCTSYVESVDNYVEQQSHRIAQFYKRNEVPSSSAAPVHAGEADEEETDTRKVQEPNMEFNIGGVSNTARSNAVEGGPSIDFQYHSEAGREPGTRSVENAQEAGAPIISSAKQESGAPSLSQVSPTVPSDWYASITVRDLFHTAVGKFPMLYVPRADFYRNRLNCIIGEAVSGKSRLLETLMGACDLPQGEVRIDGKNVWSCRRNDIGVCLQKSVFWENLTVPENIRLIQLLKGHISDPAELRAEEEILLSAMQLTDLRRERAGRLTTGVARKLAVAMALAGGSHTIFFDEPTASTDISSRQEIWHLLSQNARGRCIVVSTSEVEDVDVFADHITVLHGGRVCLTGTPEYLRWKLRGGWVVTVCRAANTELETILNRVHSVAPDAILVSNVGHEISFQVTERVSLHTLPVMLTELRSARESGLISNITVSDASLGESFVRLTRMLN
ncbi:putative ABC transporter, partial [Trypanosoma cruzi]